MSSPAAETVVTTAASPHDHAPRPCTRPPPCVDGATQRAAPFHLRPSTSHSARARVRAPTPQCLLAARMRPAPLLAALAASAARADYLLQSVYYDAQCANAPLFVLASYGGCAPLTGDNFVTVTCVNATAFVLSLYTDAACTSPFANVSQNAPPPCTPLDRGASGAPVAAARVAAARPGAQSAVPSTMTCLCSAGGLHDAHVHRGGRHERARHVQRDARVAQLVRRWRVRRHAVRERVPARLRGAGAHEPAPGLDVVLAGAARQGAA